MLYIFQNVAMFIWSMSPPLSVPSVRIVLLLDCTSVFNYFHYFIVLFFSELDHVSLYKLCLSPSSEQHLHGQFKKVEVSVLPALNLLYSRKKKKS